MKKNKYGLLIGVIFILCVTYYFTLAPGLSWANGAADGGDLITAVAVRGVPHPTGYPLYLIVGKLFLLLPIGNIAFRLNVMSAVFTILAAGIIFSTIKRINPDNLNGQLGAVFGALLFGLAPLIWSHAVVAEVYSMQSFLVMCIVYQTLFYNESSREDFLRGMVFGLALDNHITTVLLFPLILLSQQKGNIAPINSLAKRAIGLMLSLSIYIILPIHAANNPPINWLNPVTIDSFIAIISGRIYNSYLSLNFILQNARGSIGVLIKNLGFPVLTLLIYMFLEGQTDRYIKHTLSWVFVIFILFTLFFTAYDSFIHLTNSVLASALLVGIGFEKITTALSKHHRGLNWALIIPSFAFIFLKAERDISEVNAAHDNRAEIFAKSILNIAPDNALLFTIGDQATFTLWYFHFAERERPDISIISEGLLKFGWYQHILKTTYPNLGLPDLTDLTIDQIIRRNESHPYCFVEAESTNTLCYINEETIN